MTNAAMSERQADEEADRVFEAEDAADRLFAIADSLEAAANAAVQYPELKDQISTVEGEARAAATDILLKAGLIDV